MGATWLPSIGAGISLAVGHGGGLYLLAFAMLLGIALEAAAAWTLVVEAGKDPRDKDVVPGPRTPPNRREPGSWLPEKTNLGLCLGKRRMSLLVSPGRPVQTVDDRMPGGGQDSKLLGGRT
jgi:hypothetical protein